MKNKLSKNTVIVLFAFSNLVLGAYIVIEKTDFRFWELGAAKAEAAAKAPNTAAVKAGAMPPALFKNDNELQACYEALLARGPEIDEGTVQLHMTITKDGDIDFLDLVHSDLNDQEFTECILDKVKSKRIPATADRMGVMISHKFNFKKRETGNVEFQ